MMIYFVDPSWRLSKLPTGKTPGGAKTMAAAVAADIHDVDCLSTRVRQSRVAPENGRAWSAERDMQTRLRQQTKRLATHDVASKRLTAVLTLLIGGCARFLSTNDEGLMPREPAKR